MWITRAWERQVLQGEEGGEAAWAAVTAFGTLAHPAHKEDVRAAHQQASTCASTCTCAPCAGSRRRVHQEARSPPHSTILASISSACAAFCLDTSRASLRCGGSAAP